MLRTLIVRNRKSHKDTRVDFCPGVNIIFGRSQSGKSAFLDGLDWLRRNRPLGITKLSWFAKKGAEMLAQAEVPEGVVSLVKSSKKSEYRVGKRKLTGFKTDVPGVVKRVLNISDLNIQRQLSKHYLILSSPPDVARAINDITGLSALDPALNWIATEIQKRKDRVKDLEEKLASKKEELRKYRNIPKLLRRIATAEKLYSSLARSYQSSEELRAAIASVRKARRGLSDTEKVDIARIEQLFEEADMKLKELGRLTNVSDVVSDAISAKRNAQKYQSVATSRLDTAKKKLRRILEDAKGVCPFCGKELEDDIESIIESLE